MNTRYKKHLEAFKNTVVSVVSSGERCKSHGGLKYRTKVKCHIKFYGLNCRTKIQ